MNAKVLLWKDDYSIEEGRNLKRINKNHSSEVIYCKKSKYFTLILLITRSYGTVCNLFMVKIFEVIHC